MGSRNDVPDAKEMFESVRRFGKRFLEYLYAAAEKDGNFLLPQEAIAVFFRFLRDQPDRPGVSTDVPDLEPRLQRRLYRQLCDDALAAYRRHTPGFDIKKGQPGRKPEIELAERIWKLKAEGRTVPQMQAIFKAEGQHFSREKIESYLKTRRKSLK